MSPDVPPPETAAVPTPLQPGRPKVILLFKIYCIFIVLCGLFSIGFGCFVLTFNPSTPGPARNEGIQIAALYFAMGAFSVFPALVGLFLPRRPWAWIFSLVLLGCSMLSCCCTGVAAPLLIFYLRPEVKAYYYGNTMLTVER